MRKMVLTFVCRGAIIMVSQLCDNPLQNNLKSTHFQLRGYIFAVTVAYMRQNGRKGRAKILRLGRRNEGGFLPICQKLVKSRKKNAVRRS